VRLHSDFQRKIFSEFSKLNAQPKVTLNCLDFCILRFVGFELKQEHNSGVHFWTSERI
jgi:hypothetical protein